MNEESDNRHKELNNYSYILDLYFDNNISPLALLDKEFNFIRVNKAYAQADERNPSYFIGKNHFDLYPSEENKKLFQQVVDTQTPFRVKAKPFTYAYNPEKGVSYWDWSLAPISVDGEMLLMFSLYDVTDRVRAIEDLQRLFDYSADLLSIIDDEGHFININQAWEQALGYEHDELITQVLIDMIHKDDQTRTSEAIRKCMNKKMPVLDIQNRLVRKDQSYLWVEWAFVPDSDRNLIYADARDITERKKIEEEMFRLERLNLIGEMAAGISHEVRNPMATVRGFLQILSQKEECANYNDFFDIMIEELDRANNIISEFLSLGRNKTPEKMQYHNLNTILEALLPLLQADALCQDKYVRCELQDIPDLMVDDKEIRQVILNLVRNGLEAMSKGGEVIISTTQQEKEIILSVKDQGSGIPLDLIEKLGTPFLTTKKKGTGLGLTTCYSIAHRHGAALSVDTGSEGTTFYLTFNAK